MRSRTHVAERLGEAALGRCRHRLVLGRPARRHGGAAGAADRACEGYVLRRLNPDEAGA